jgi:hypothetical protein
MLRYKKMNGGLLWLILMHLYHMGMSHLHSQFTVSRYFSLMMKMSVDGK